MCTYLNVLTSKIFSSYIQGGFSSALPTEGEYVERDEEPVEEVVGEDRVQRRDVETKDVVQVVKVVQVLRHQVLQPVQAPVAATTKKEGD